MTHPLPAVQFSRRGALGALIALGASPSRAAAPAVMLAQSAPADPDPAGFLVSEKFDGVRALWDGRMLRFRSGHAVHAPDWFAARLPATPLDGELWLGRGRFDALSGIVRKAQPLDAEWRTLHYEVFDLPAAPGPFAERAERLAAIVRATAWPQLQAVEQAALSDHHALQRRLAEVLQAGGEGLVLHRAAAHWRPGRSGDVLKLKPQDDAEAVVIGHEPGQGRLEGRLGALRVRTEGGVEFLLGSGFSDEQRANPPARGSVVTFTYRGLTAGGVPRFASFLRLREL